LALSLAASPAVAQVPIVEEVPFITTPDRVTLAMLKLAGVRATDHVLDLGSGDGRIVITAAKRFGATGLGVEIVPDLVARSRASAERAGVAQRARFVEQDLFDTDLSSASVITMYLLPAVNLQLRPRLLALAPGTRIVSHDWDLGDWRPDVTLALAVPEKTIGREKLSRIHRWVVPAQVQGTWCASNGARLRIEQRYQFVDADLTSAGTAWAMAGRLEGASLTLLGERGDRLTARIGNDQLRLSAASGAKGSALPKRWQRSHSQGCPADGAAR
jgi:SAM-dependent methyltransferase